MSRQSRFPIEKFQFRSDSVLESLPIEDWKIIEASMVFRKYKKKQFIFAEGTFPSGVFYLKQGKVKKYKSDRDGKEQIIYICSAGELFGYPALLSGESYSDSAATLEESIIGFIPQKDFMRVLEKSTALSNNLLKNLSHEFGVLSNSIVTFAHRTVRERLALALLILKEKYQDQADQDKPVEISLSREDLSNIVGTAIETLARLLHEFKDEGLIETEGRIIRVLDAKRMFTVANFF